MAGLSKLSRALPEKVKKMLIESLVFPHLTYCATVWAGCGKTQRKRLQKVMNHCAQIVKGARRSAHVTRFMSELNWPPVEHLIAERDMAMMHWVLTNPHASVSLREQIVSRQAVSARSTRGTAAGHLQLPRVRTEHARRFFMYRATSLWNDAPDTVRKAKTSLACRKQTRKWLQA